VAFAIQINHGGPLKLPAVPVLPSARPLLRWLGLLVRQRVLGERLDDLPAPRAEGGLDLRLGDARVPFGKILSKNPDQKNPEIRIKSFFMIPFVGPVPDAPPDQHQTHEPDRAKTVTNQKSDIEIIKNTNF